ncbi:MAG: WxcM-like domain-containing protein [Bryobacterales bacterium]|nr:WxcM-like domain-containing protein [Bryobacterales bacterium]MBV9398572.1 WxcM-like domain-containing protein [Bryobacterales bacterium]
MTASTVYFKHDTAIVECGQIGTGTRVWAFAHILPGAKIGADCNICDHAFIENDVVIGDRVTIKCGVQIWDGIRIEDDVFIGPNATFTNDPFPRSKQYRAEYPRTLVRRWASIGANATILPGITIGERAMVGAGAVVTHNVPPHAKVLGNPARIVGYADAKPEHPAPPLTSKTEPAEDTRAGAVTVHHMPVFEDLRGMLSFGEIERDVPFEVKRYFLVFDVASEEIRGEHAHRCLHQFLICVAGRCHVVTDDGIERREFILDSPAKGVHIPPMVWATQYKFTRDAILLVLASDFYDATDYIRDYGEFRVLRGRQP